MGMTRQVGDTASEYVHRHSITKSISDVEQISVGSGEKLSIMNKVANTTTDKIYVTNTAVDDQVQN